MIAGLDAALRAANRDDAVKVIVLQGAGDHFCAGFDFSGGLDHVEMYREEGYDPGIDVFKTTSSYTSGIAIFMGLWRGPQADHRQGAGLLPRRRIGARPQRRPRHRRRRRPLRHPLLRVWGCHLTGMWIYRLGLAKPSTTPSPASGSAAARP